MQSNGPVNQSKEIPLEPTLIEFVLAHLARSPKVFAFGAAFLAREHFEPNEVVYWIVWSCIKKHYETYGQPPTAESLSAPVLAYLQQDATVPGEALADANDLIKWIWREYTDDKLETDVAIDWLQLWVRKRTLQAGLADLATKSLRSGNVMNDLSRLQSALTRIEAIQNTQSVELIPEELEEDARIVVPCGNPLFDVRMEGGNYVPEVNALMAPTGVGKSMCAVDIVCSRAEAQAALEVANPGSGKLAVLISYEENIKQLRPRFWARVAQVHKTRAENIRRYDELSRRGNLQDYELERFRNNIQAGEDPPGEYERLMAARRSVMPFVNIGDFSGSREGGSAVRGFGGIPEIKRYLESIVHSTGRQIDTVVIDWAGMCVRRYLRHLGKEDEHRLTGELTDFIDQVYTQIAAHFGCIGWVCHQLAGKYNDRAPNFKFHHAHAEWCASFAVNAWFAFVLGTKDPATNTVVLRCTKTRRGEAMRETVCYIDGAFGRLREAREFVIDAQNQSIVRREDLDRVFTQADAPQRVVHPGLSVMPGI